MVLVSRCNENSTAYYIAGRARADCCRGSADRHSRARTRARFRGDQLNSRASNRLPQGRLLTSMGRQILNLRSSLVVLVLVCTAHAATLKPETVNAWREYVQSATQKLQAPFSPTSHFLQIDEDQHSLRMVRTGDVLVTPGPSQGVKKVPSGLIHDWVGTAFIANSTLSDVLSVLRDYDRYEDFYRPTVIHSRTLETGERDDRFSMVLMNQALFMKAALDSDYRSTHVRLSDRRWYSISESTRIQEIQNYGASGQHALPEGEGSGFLWRLFTVTRLEERDSGVYVEIEAIALSRDIPISLRWIVEPIVRRISRTSLSVSLRQTETAVRSGAALTAWNSRPQAAGSN
jgi:hypothetical protein